MGNDSYSNNGCASNNEFWVPSGRELKEYCHLTSCVNFLFLLQPFPFYTIVPWNGTFFHRKAAAQECGGHAPLSAIWIRDKNQSSTLENSISLRYEYSSKRKSEIVCCFQTNPLKVIWSSAANYRALWAASRLHRTPLPPPFPTDPPSAPFQCSSHPVLMFQEPI